MATKIPIKSNRPQGDLEWLDNHVLHNNDSHGDLGSVMHINEKEIHEKMAELESIKEKALRTEKELYDLWAKAQNLVNGLLRITHFNSMGWKNGRKLNENGCSCGLNGGTNEFISNEEINANNYENKSQYDNISIDKTNLQNGEGHPDDYHEHLQEQPMDFSQYSRKRKMLIQEHSRNEIRPSMPNDGQINVVLTDTQAPQVSKSPKADINKHDVNKSNSEDSIFDKVILETMGEREEVTQSSKELENAIASAIYGKTIMGSQMNNNTTDISHVAAANVNSNSKRKCLGINENSSAKSKGTGANNATRRATLEKEIQMRQIMKFNGSSEPPNIKNKITPRTKKNRSPSQSILSFPNKGKSKPTPGNMIMNKLEPQTKKTIHSPARQAPNNGKIRTLQDNLIISPSKETEVSKNRPSSAPNKELNQTSTNVMVGHLSKRSLSQENISRLQNQPTNITSQQTLGLPINALPSERNAAPKQLIKIQDSCKVCTQVATFLCSSCVNAWYCSAECQIKDWERHTSICHAPRERNQVMEVGHLQLSH